MVNVATSEARCTKRSLELFQSPKTNQWFIPYGMECYSEINDQLPISSIGHVIPVQSRKLRYKSLDGFPLFSRRLGPKLDALGFDDKKEGPEQCQLLRLLLYNLPHGSDNILQHLGRKGDSLGTTRLALLRASLSCLVPNLGQGKGRIRCLSISDIVTYG